MNTLLIVFVVIFILLLVAVSMYMVKTKVIIDDKKYDAIIWTIRKMLMFIPILIAVFERSDLKYGGIIITVLTSILAILNKIVTVSKSNYKVKAEDGDTDLSEDPSEILDELTEIGGEDNGNAKDRKA